MYTDSLLEAKTRVHPLSPFHISYLPLFTLLTQRPQISPPNLISGLPQQVVFSSVLAACFETRREVWLW